MKNLTEIFIKYRALTGIICLIALLYFAEPTAKSITIGFFLMIGGMFFRAWSSGYLNKNDTLAKQGPYELTRNPLYFGNFILGLGIAIAGNTVYTYAIFFLYYLLFFPLLMIIEHRRLKQKFGKEYEEWSRNSHSFIPKIKRVKSFNFNISFYMKNKEYKVLFFSLFTIAILILKYLKIIRTS